MPRTPVLFALLLILCVTGCAPRYTITLNNNNVITTRGRPKLNKEETMFRYTDLTGKEGSVPRFRVKEIAPLR